jgi:hypothetical protein
MNTLVYRNREYKPSKYINEGLDTVVLAYAAGFIDGEGHIRAQVNKNQNTGPDASPTRTRLRLSVSQKRIEPLEFLKDEFRVGNIKFCVQYDRRLGNKKTRRWEIHTWDVNCRQAEQVIRAVLPFLIVKRAEAVEALINVGYEIPRNRKSLLRAQYPFPPCAQYFDD